MGDPSGIGPEIISKALPRIKDLADFVIIGDGRIFNKTSRFKLLAPNFTFIDLANVFIKRFRWGKVSSVYGKASIEYLDRGLELWRRDQIDCLVTGPISKESIHKAGFAFSGHTEYLEQALHCKDTVMMLLNDRIKISLVTRHIPFKDVSRALTRRKVATAILASAAFLKNVYAKKFPRIVVCGLNPHASDNGVIGSEENRVIAPVVRRLRRTIPRLEGPLPADVALAKACDTQFDCAIAMYHDQALIALKVLGDKAGVNLTLGLPFIRTSPLHGTAFDIAGRDLASPDSLIAAIKCAIYCAANRHF